MKQFFVGIVGLAMMAQPFAAQAQGASAVEDEFSAFRSRLQAATPEEAASQPADPAPAAQAAQQPAASDVVADPLAATAGNPLGPAASLPLSGQAPATAATLVPQSPEEMKLLMEAEAQEQRRRLEEETFNAAMKQLLPLTPEQIRRTYDGFKVSREAAETPITVPEPRQVVETLSLDPSDTPAIIRMSPGHVTTFTILDSTGAPWPIQDISWAGKFDVVTPETGGHILRMTPQTAHGIGNISIRLVDLITPVTLRLVTGIDEVHYRFDARIPRPGPNAKTPIIEYGGLKATAGHDDGMVGILDGTTPSGAQKLQVKGADGRTTAWRLSDKVYLRTPLTLLSPAWDSSVSSADGMTVYTINKAPVIILSDQGRMVRAQISMDEVSQ